MKPKISIIGCGKVGTALAVFLSKAGYKIAGLSSRTINSARKTAKNSGSGTIFNNPEDAAMVGDIIFITTPDNIIEKVCSDITKKNILKKETTIFHCSGALSSKILISAFKKGFYTGSIHPLQSFAPYKKNQKSPFKGINISIEGEKEAIKKGEKIINNLKANFFTIPTNAKILYHTAAVVASNYLVTLQNFALYLLYKAGLSEDKAYEILEPLIYGTLNNIKNRGIKNSLTGPLARGDTEIVASHIKDIKKNCPEFSELYKLLGEHTLKIAQAKKKMDGKTIAKFLKMFQI